MKAIENIEIKINRLSPGMIMELDHYLDHLIHQSKDRSKKKLRKKWKGGLSDLNMNSIELQKMALTWRQKSNI
jgi:hypothetical protein